MGTGTGTGIENFQKLGTVRGTGTESSKKWGYGYGISDGISTGISPRRSSYTASNTNKRLTLSNLIPQKRRLESDMTGNNVKKTKLFNNK